jgi:hypothetical protein
MNRKKTVLVLTIIVLVILAFGIARIYRDHQREACIKKGGYWNKELNKCQSIDDTSDLKAYYWHTAYDSTLHREYLEKGKLLNSYIPATTGLIEVLNKRAEKCKIKYLDQQNDTLHIRILNDEVLTEQLGTSGAHCYLGETVYTLTENDSVKQVKIDFTEGSHASPGTYNRADFVELIPDKQ